MNHLEQLYKALTEDFNERRKAQALFAEKAAHWEQIEIPTQLLEITRLIREHTNTILLGKEGRYRTVESLSEALERLQSLRRKAIEIWKQR